MIAVTGASGYIGKRVLAELTRRGIEWAALTRSASGHGRQVPFQLGAPLSNELRELSPLSGIIHLAASTTTEPVDVEAELRSVDLLSELAHARGTRLTFASSQTSAPDAPTGYGRLKSALEQRVSAGGGISVRIGLVYGGARSGLFGLLCRVVGALPVLPWFVPDPAVQPIHVDDLASALVHIATSAQPLPQYQLGAPQPVGFSRFLHGLARLRVRRFRLFVPVPTIALSIVRRLWMLVGTPPASISRLESLFRLPRLSLAQQHLEQLGVTLRPLEAGLTRAGTERRAVLREGRRVLRHLAGREIPAVLLRRYARLFERPATSSERRSRALVATRILEASPLGASLMLAGPKSNRLVSALSIAKALTADLFFLVRTR